MNRCESCAMGFYGNATLYPKPQCKACDCYHQGTVTPPGHNLADPLPCDDEGKCTCLSNVIGEKCDGCKDTFWNVGSGFGCEECLCNPIGSVNDSCNIITGQCPCKPGVTGRICDRCEPDHYTFSEEGCSACNCNSQGSLNESCNEFGVCNCKSGVLGIKCDSCAENKHNLIAGCIACPPCYDQIQTLVDRLRTNLRELVKITAQFNSSKPGDVIVDLNFDSRFKQLTEAVNSLLEKAEESNSTDRRLQQQLEILNERVGNITELLAEASSKTNLSEAYVASMLKNIEEAEASINRSRSMLDEAERLLLKEGLVALNESIHAANTSSKQAVRMVEILNKTSDLADRHEKEANTIAEKAIETKNKSQQAYDATQGAAKELKKTTDGIEELLKKLNKTITLHEQAADAVNQSRGAAQIALDEANELYETGIEPLTDIGLPEMKAKVNLTKEEVANASQIAEDIIEVLEPLVESFDKKEEDVRKKMAEWPGLVKRLENLLSNVTEANDTAHDAIARGEKTLEQAKDMLERLQKFNEIINKSRSEAERAEENVQEIERLISSANNKSDEATVILGHARKSAQNAMAVAEEAEKAAGRAKEKAEMIKKEAEELDIPEDNVTEPVMKAGNKLKEYAEVADNERDNIATALKRTKTAGAASKRARDKIDEVRQKLLALLKEIDEFGVVNNTRVNRMDNLVNNLTSTLNVIERDVKNVEQTRTVVDQKITSLTLDLTKLKAAKKALEENYEKLPKVCTRQTPKTEQ